MVKLTKTFLLVGRNQKMLIEKLKKAQINLYKIEILSQKKAKITIDAKDTLKYFAICKNSWYNKELKMGGILSPFYLMVKNWMITCCFALFFIIIFLANNLYFETVYQGDALLFRAVIEKQFESAGITKFCFFNQTKLDQVKKSLESEKNLAFITIKKSGNRAVVTAKQSQTAPKNLYYSSNDLIADQDMLILNVTVYSGTQVASQGQFVKKGEVIALASYFLNEEKIPTLLFCEVTAQLTFEYIHTVTTPITGDAKENAIAKAKFLLGDYLVQSVSAKQINKNQIRVILKYEKRITGG